MFVFAPLIYPDFQKMSIQILKKTASILQITGKLRANYRQIAKKNTETSIKKHKKMQTSARKKGAAKVPLKKAFKNPHPNEALIRLKR